MQCITFDRYIEAFRVLEKYSVEYPFMLDHLLGVADECFPCGLSMLDIGAGTGKFARSFIEQCRVPVLGYTAIEPSGDHVAQIRQNMAGIPVEKEIICDYFTPATGFGRSFDLVLLSHCTYCFMPDPEPYLLHALELVNDSGTAVIYHGSPTNFCYILNLLWRDILPAERVTDPTFTSWNVRDILERHNIPHEVTCLPGTLMARELFSPEGEQLLDELITFSLMVESGSLPQKVLGRTKEMLREIACPGRKGPVLNLGVDAITVKKSPA
ncbi:MAG TPA: class I SAM-dependent methyltransferase [Methanolinea sp.]|nr:class I SAM-dependent methyltransferase [Methanolinea sp.]HQK56838.1 class I SAM-dependent methyltransferase [Methanolinea sp.]